MGLLSCPKAGVCAKDFGKAGIPTYIKVLTFLKEGQVQFSKGQKCPKKVICQ